MIVMFLALSSPAWAGDFVPYDGGDVYDIADDVGGDGGIMLLSSHSISGSYGVGSSNVSIFAGVVSKLPVGDHYVYWRDGQYSYVLAHSRELVYEGGRFTAPQVQLVTYYTYTGSSGQATYSQSTDSNFTLSPGNFLVWSDLGDYPQLETGKGERDYVQAAVFALAVFFVFGRFTALWRSIRGRDS